MSYRERLLEQVESNRVDALRELAIRDPENFYTVAAELYGFDGHTTEDLELHAEALELPPLESEWDVWCPGISLGCAMDMKKAASGAVSEEEARELIEATLDRPLTYRLERI